MRMKEDHMKNGELKSAYNIQISTEGQFITNDSIHQRPDDFTTFISHMNQFKAHYDKLSDIVCADSGYGSEQNYTYYEDKEIEAFIKYNYFHKEQKRNYKKNIFLVANLFYNSQQDFYICPMGQKMNKILTKKEKQNWVLNMKVLFIRRKIVMDVQ